MDFEEFVVVDGYYVVVVVAATENVTRVIKVSNNLYGIFKKIICKERI